MSEGKKRPLPNTKLRKTEVLLAYPDINKHIPETAPESRVNLFHFMRQYNTVFLKPNGGTGGRGVIKASLADNQYNYQYRTSTYHFHSFDSMYESLLQYVKTRKYLIQKGISLLKFKGRPFDIRVMVQKNLKGEWEYTGMIARVAHPKKIVTNFHRGGALYPFETVIKPFLSPKGTQELVLYMEQLSLRIARALSKRYPYVHAFGVDLGLDADCKPWIIEVNTMPYPYIFKALKDKSIFRKIMRYIHANEKRVWSSYRISSNSRKKTRITS